MAALQRVATRPTWLLSQVNARAQGLLADAFAAAGLRGYHFRLLAALDQHGPASQAELARRTGIDTSDVVAALNDLVHDGFAERRRDRADRRRNIVTLTASGAVMVERLDAMLDEVQDALLAPLTTNERKTFVRALAKLT